MNGALSSRHRYPFVEALLGTPFAGTDFSTSATFTGGSGSDNLDNSGVDDLNSADNITVTNWSFVNGGKFENWDNNAKAGMPLGGGDQRRRLLGICFWREGLEAAFGTDWRGEKGG